MGRLQLSTRNITIKEAAHTQEGSVGFVLGACVLCSFSFPEIERCNNRNSFDAGWMREESHDKRDGGREGERCTFLTTIPALRRRQ